MKNTGLKKLIIVKVIFIICLKLIIVDIKYHYIDFSYYIQNYYLSQINYGGERGLGVNSALNELYTYRREIHLSRRDTLMKERDTYRRDIHLANNDTLIE